MAPASLLQVAGGSGTPQAWAAARERDVSCSRHLALEDFLARAKLLCTSLLARIGCCTALVPSAAWRMSSCWAGRLQKQGPKLIADRRKGVLAVELVGLCGTRLQLRGSSAWAQPGLLGGFCLLLGSLTLITGVTES